MAATLVVLILGLSAGFGQSTLGTIRGTVVDPQHQITPGATMPPLLRRYFDAIAGAAPDQHGTRTFRIQGQLRDPRIVAAGRFP